MILIIPEKNRDDDLWDLVAYSKNGRSPLNNGLWSNKYEAMADFLEAHPESRTDGKRIYLDIDSWIVGSH